MIWALNENVKKCVHVLIWVRLELGNTVGRAQQSGRDDVFPATPGLGDTWVCDSNVLMNIGCHAAIFIGWAVRARDERNDIALNSLCV